MATEPAQMAASIIPVKPSGGDECGASDSPKGMDPQHSPTPLLEGAVGSQDEGLVQNEKENHGNSNNSADGEITYPSMATKVAVGFSIALAIFLVGLDQTIVATAIPKISDHFKALNDIGWYASAFFLTSTALQPTFGKLYKVFNVKWVFLTAIAIFEIGSLICGLAPTSVALIVGRAIAGSGGAGIFSGAFTVITYIVPLRERPMFFASIAAVMAIASVAGPLAGGAFTEHVSWRWCFYINLPVGGVTIFIILFLLPVPHQPHASLPLRQKLEEIDFIGAFFLIPSIVCLLLALQWGGTVYPWNNSRIIGLFIGFGLMMIIFVIVQFKRGDKATLPISILKQRSVATSVLFSFLMGASLFTLIYYIPIYFQAIKNSTPSQSGTQLLPLMLSVVVFGFFSGALVTLLGYYTPFIIAGSIILTIGCGLMELYTVDQPDWRAYGFAIVAGAGAGFSFQNSVLAIQAVLPQATIAIGNAAFMFSRTLSGAIVLSICNSVLSNSLVSQISSKIPNINPQMIINAGATGIRNIVSPEVLPLVLEAYNTAVRHVFIVAIVTAGLSALTSLGFEWKSIKGKSLAERMG